MKAFLDANVIFTAAYSPNGIARKALLAQKKAGWAFVASPYVVGEAKRNLGKKADAEDDLELVLGMIELVPDASEPTWPELRAKDQPVLAAAIAAGCDALVTGDKRDFGSWLDSDRALAGIQVLSLAKLAILMLES